MLDWSLVQSFLAVMEHGSLSAGARALAISQPTLGRQIRALEAQLGAELFQRHDKGLSPTELGTSLIHSARAMREAAHDIALKAAGQGDTLSGTVRITASVAVTVYHLPEIVAAIRKQEPDITLDLVASDETSNLHFREADIAIRMYRPKQLDLIAQHVGDLALSTFATRDYLKRRGTPKRPADLIHHDIIGGDRNTHIIAGFQQLGFPVDRNFFKVRTDDPPTYWALVRAGCGIGFGQRAMYRKVRGLVEIPLDLGLPTLPIWLTAHEAIRHTPRVQRIWTLLATGLRAIADPP